MSERAPIEVIQSAFGADNVRLLERYLSLNLSTAFQLALIETVSALEERALAAWVQQRFPGTHSEVVPIDPDRATNPWRQLSEWSAHHAGPDALAAIVTGVGQHGTGNPPAPTMVALNVQRDLLVRDVHAVVLLCLRPHEWVPFATIAPDVADFATLRLRHVASQRPSLAPSLPMPSSLARTPDAPEDWPAPLQQAWSAAQKGRIDEARDQIAAYRLADADASTWEPTVQLVLGLVANRAGELDDAIASLTHALQEAQDEGTKLLAARVLAEVFTVRGRMEEALALLEDAEQVARGQGLHRIADELALERASTLILRGEWGAAETTAREVLERAQSEDGEGELAAEAWSVLAEVYQTRGEYDEALQMRIDHEIPILERLGDTRARAISLSRVSDILRHKGSLDEALRILRVEVMPELERLGSARDRTITLGKIADVMEARGDRDAAHRIREREVVPALTRLGDARSSAVEQGKVADFHAKNGNLSLALRILQQHALPVFERLGDPHARAVTLGRIASILHAQGDLDAALRILQEEALPVYEALGDAFGRAFSLEMIARIHGDQGDHRHARRVYLEEVFPALERHGRRKPIAVAKVNYALLELAAGHPSRSLDQLNESVVQDLFETSDPEQATHAGLALVDCLLQTATPRHRARARRLLRDMTQRGDLTKPHLKAYADRLQVALRG